MLMADRDDMTPRMLSVQRAIGHFQSHQGSPESLIWLRNEDELLFMGPFYESSLMKGLLTGGTVCISLRLSVCGLSLSFVQNQHRE